MLVERRIWTIIACGIVNPGMPARVTPHDEKFSKKKPPQQFTIKSIIKQQATSFKQFKTNKNFHTQISFKKANKTAK